MLFGNAKPKPRGLLGALAMSEGAPDRMGMFQQPQQPMAPQMGQAMGMDQQRATQPHEAAGPGFFQQGGTGRAIAGSLGDALMQMGGLQPIYAPAMQERRQMAQRQQMQQAQAHQAQQERMQGREDYVWQRDFDTTHPKAVQPHYWESNDGSLMALGADGQPAKVYQDPSPRMNFIPDGQGGGQWVAVPTSGMGAPSGMPDKPTGKLTPIGGGAGGGTGGFPVSGNRLDRVTVQAESGGNPNAVSPVGARGLWQVMPATARDPGFGIRPSNGSQQDDARVGSEYRRAMEKRYGGDLGKMWGAYNWGPGNVDAAIAQHGANWLNHAPAETKNYVRRNMRAVRGN